MKSHEDDNIIVLISNENVGYARGYNIGIRYSLDNYSLDYLFIINSDILFKKNVIDCCINCLEAEAKYALVSTLMLDKDGNKDNSCWKYPTYTMLLRNCFKILKKDSNRYYDYIEKPYMDVDVVRGSFLCFRASVLKEIDGFDEGTFLYYEENIICKRLNKAGYKVGIISTCSYIHNHKVKQGIVYHNRRIGLESCYYYLKNYTEVKYLQLVLFKMASKYCIIKQFVINTLKHLIQLK